MSYATHQEKEWVARCCPHDGHDENGDQEPPPTRPRPIEERDGNHGEAKGEGLDQGDEGSRRIAFDPDEGDGEEGRRSDRKQDRTEPRTWRTARPQALLVHAR